MQLRTRFAPSPTGLLHIGNAYSAFQCMQWAEQQQGTCLLRIEDIDHTRCKSKFTAAIIEDLHWLGINFSAPPMLQSKRMAIYQSFLDKLHQMDVIYPCFCTRSDIQEELKRMASAPHRDEPLPEYPGSCRHLSSREQQQRMRHQTYAWRLHAEYAQSLLNKPLSWRDENSHSHAVSVQQDMVIGRKDIGVSYHLAVVVDDAEQGISHIIRGEDLRESVGLHRLLQSLLSLPEPTYIHHRLVRNVRGNRLAKRRAGTTLRSLREMGIAATQLRQYLLHSTDLIWPDTEQEMKQMLAALGKHV